MKVMKFGGTSVGSVNSILSVKRIVEAVDEPVIVVVSALGGITDKLINTSRMAAAGDASYENEFREIVYRHVEMIKEVIPAGEAQVALQRQIGELLNELKDIFQGIYLIKDLSQKTSDTIVSYGERLSSIIVAQLTGAEWFDSRKFIKTEKKHSKHVLDTELTNSLVRETFSSLPKRVLVPGFISTDKMTGEVTNLGRGGSDYTAAIIAAALDAIEPEQLGGFRTVSAKPEADGSRPVYLHPAAAQDLFCNAHNRVGIRRPALGIASFPDAFETAGLAALADAEDCDLILMDEIGRMERHADAYSARIRTLLDGVVPILGVVQKKADTPLAAVVRSHPNVCLLEVSAENRNNLLPEILTALHTSAAS